MRRRLTWLSILAAGLGFALAAFASTQRGNVDEVQVMEVKVQQVKMPKDGVDVTEPHEVRIKKVQVTKVGLEDSTVNEVRPKATKVEKIIFEGLTDINQKKQPVTPDDEAAIDQAAQKAEADQGPAGGGQQQMAEQRAENEGSVMTEQQAMNGGRSATDASAIGDATRQRIRDDYARAADGGSLTAPPPLPPPPAAAPAENQPEVLEAPKQEGAEGAGEGAGMQVVDVPQPQN
jgi:hypothetical protein